MFKSRESIEAGGRSRGSARCTAPHEDIPRIIIKKNPSYESKTMTMLWNVPRNGIKILREDPESQKIWTLSLIGDNNSIDGNLSPENLHIANFQHLGGVFLSAHLKCKPDSKWHSISALNTSEQHLTCTAEGTSVVSIWPFHDGWSCVKNPCHSHSRTG